MKTITVQVREDHLETVAKSKPMTAIAELIWNALDAEATEVNVRFQLNELDGLEAIQVADNGTGLHYDDGIMVFQSLGGSWKRPNGRTHEYISLIVAASGNSLPGANVTRLAT